MAECQFIHEGAAGSGKTWVRCPVCGMRFACPDEHLATLRGRCPGPREPWPVQLAGGPGTELKAMLGGWPLYLEITPGCTCLATAAQMDAWGPDECSKPERLAWIVERLGEEAKARKLPFLEAAARLLVRRAIVRARRAAAALPAGGQG